MNIMWTGDYNNTMIFKCGQRVGYINIIVYREPVTYRIWFGDI